MGKLDVVRMEEVVMGQCLEGRYFLLPAQTTTNRELVYYPFDHGTH